MGIIKIELPLIDIDISPLKQYNIDLLVNKIDNCWKLRSFNENIKLSEISDYYIKSILINRKLNIIKYNNELKNIILVDFDEIPNQIDNIPQDIQEELFKIISAPVPDLPYTSFARDAKDHLSKYSWGEHGIKYIIKTTGGVLSLIDKNLLNFFSDSYKRDTNTSVLDDSDHLYMCNLLANNININIEFAILIIMLKKTNEHNDLYNKTNRPKNLFRIRNEYNENILFINKLQDSCYGTVTEQTSQIEEMMPYYLKTELNKSNQIALDTILRERDQQKSERFINFISIGSLFLSLIFGLPSIYDALVLLHKTFSIANLDIPFITLESSSVFLWLLLNFLILIKLLFKK